MSLSSGSSSQANEEKLGKKIDLLNAKVKKYEEILDRKNKELTEMQTSIETYKKKTYNYSENNSAIAIRNASLERACREIALDKMKLEKENAKLSSASACRSQPVSSSSQYSNSSTTTLKKDFQLKITKYLRGNTTRRNIEKRSKVIEQAPPLFNEKHETVELIRNVHPCLSELKEPVSPINRPPTPSSSLKYEERFESQPSSPKHSLPSDIGSTSSRKKQRRWNSPLVTDSAARIDRSPSVHGLLSCRTTFPLSPPYIPLSTSNNCIVVEEEDEIIFL
nr:unnamed protein product [Naegleria fowleri]